MERFYLWVAALARGVARWADTRREKRRKKLFLPMVKVVRSGRQIFKVGDQFTDSGGGWEVVRVTPRYDHFEYVAERVSMP